MDDLKVTKTNDKLLAHRRRRVRLQVIHENRENASIK